MASTNYINECKKMTYENRYGKLAFSSPVLELNQSNKIQDFSINDGCYIDGNIVGSVYSKCLNAHLINALEDKIENCQFTASVGVKYIEDDEEVIEYIDLGNYVVEKPKDEQTENFSSFTSYDLLMNHLEDVYTTALDYEQNTITIGDVYEELCVNLGLVPVTTTFTNSTIEVENNPFKNNETNRIVLNAIAKVACAFVDINYDNNKIDLKWLNSSLDYTFQQNDYSTLEGGKTIYGPVNSLIIRNSQVESENVSYSDQQSITQNGEHQLVISEDYFLYNETKRNQALSGIWNKVNGLTYVECTLTSLTGKPFLRKGNKIRIYTDENNYIDSYILEHTFTFDGSFKSVIKSPVLTEQQVQTKQPSIQNKAQRTELMVDKQNQAIEGVITRVDGQDEQIATIRLQYNELLSRISDIADITTSGESSYASVNLTDVNASQPIDIKIHPISENICYLYPRNNLYPSDILYPRSRTLRFTNTDTSEVFDWIIPTDLWWYDNTTYDELELNYGDGTNSSVIVTRKCQINADGSVSVLATPTTETYPYPSWLVLTDGDYTISLIDNSTGYLYVQLMAKNIYTTQFYTKAETNTLVNQTANSITSGVNQTLTNYSTTQQTNTTITQAILNNNSAYVDIEVKKKVNNTDFTKANIVAKINDNTSQVQIDADNIDLSGKTINLTSDEIAITSTNFSLDKNGNMVANSGTYKGNIEISSDEYEYNPQNYKIKVYNSSTLNNCKIYPDGIILSKNDSVYEPRSIISTASIISTNGDYQNYQGQYTYLSPWWIRAIDFNSSIPTREQTRITAESVRTPELIQGSTAEIKKDFELLNNALEIIKNTDIYKYHLLNQNDNEKKHIGLVIGNKYKYSTELTNSNNDGVDLYSMVSVCLQAIKEQQEQINELKKEINKLKESDK